MLEDTERFERGLLVADVAGTRFMVAHLHAQDAVMRAKEAAWVAVLIGKYSKAGIPLVLLGDLNTISPLDANCATILGTVPALLRIGVPPYLRQKYLTDRGGSAANKTSKYAIDFRPFEILLASGLVDLFGASSDAVVEDRESCLARCTFPSSAFGSDADDAGNDNGVVPLRLDFALANQLLRGLRPALRCRREAAEGVLGLSDHFALVCAST